MARGGFERPPRWAIAVMLVGVLALVVGFGYAATQKPHDPVSKAERARMDAAASAAAASESAVASHVLGFLGDSYTLGTGADAPSHSYARLAASELHWSARTFAEGGTGYTNPGKPPETVFLARVPDVVAAGPKVVIVQGSTNDAGDTATIRAAATSVFRALHKGLPKAALYALGPLNTPASSPAQIDRSREAVRAAAEATGVTYIDPTGWLDPADKALWVDGFHPSPRGHQLIADRLAAALRSKLPA